jgi:hypothetical protein
MTSIALPTSPRPVEIVLDLRQLHEPPESTADLLSLWSVLSPALRGRPLAPGGEWSLQHPAQGKIGFTIISVPSGEEVVGAETSFAVHSVLEAPVIHHACSVCAGARQRRYGPFLCARCREEEKQTRLCDEHVIVLDGAMTSLCPRHRPKAASGEWATFWCSGPACRRKQVAWPEADRRRHPHEPSIWYCPGCYAELFPTCSSPACTDLGSNTCEHVDPRTQRPCGSRLCNRHVRRWQIYGPKWRGLSLCRSHPAIKTQTAEQLVYQMLAGTALRRSLRLPFLSKVRFTLQKAHGRLYELQSIYDLFARVSRGSSSVDLLRLVREREPEWKREIGEEGTRQREGLRHFERVRAELVSLGLGQIATALVYSDYRATHKRLFVRLDESLRGRMVGRGGATIKQIQDRTGVTITFERLSSV